MKQLERPTKQMKQLSIAEQEKQVKALEQRAKTAESLAFSKNAAAQAAQRKLDDLSKQFERETARLKAKQKTELELSRQELLNSIDNVQVELESKIAELTETNEKYITVQSEVAKETERLTIALNAIESSQNELTEVRKQQIQADEAVSKANQKRIDFELSNSVLSTEKMSLQDEINRLQAAKKQLLMQIEELVNDYTSQKTYKEGQIDHLNTQIVDLTTELNQKAEEDRVTREYLAEWQVRLAAQDQNLRIREVKVAEGETKIVRNANLLNL